MPIWDLIGAPLETEHVSEGGLPIINSTYSSVIGDGIQFFIGGGRDTNIYGADTKLVVDWEELFDQGGLSVGGSTFPGITGGGMLAMGTILGVGGDTAFLFGNKTAFSYYGDSFTVDRARHSVAIKESLVPLPVKVLAGLGALGVLSAALALRLKYSIYQGTQTGLSPGQKEKLVLATILIPALESRWLFALKCLEYLTDVAASAIPKQVDQITHQLADTRKNIADLEQSMNQWLELANQNPATTVPGFSMISAALDEAAETLAKLTEAKTQLIAQAAGLGKSISASGSGH